MCATCGCDSGEQTMNLHHHDHTDEHNGHTHSKTVVAVEKDILYQNNLLAERNRGYFEAKNILSSISSAKSSKCRMMQIVFMPQALKWCR